MTPTQQPVIIGIKCTGRGSSFTLTRATLQMRLTAMHYFRMPSPPATDGALVCDDKGRG